MLTACDNREDTNDLSQYIAQSKLTTQNTSSSLTTITQTDTPIFKPNNVQRNPFIPSMQIESKPVYRLNSNRIKEPLESIALNHLHMVGTIQIDSLVWALIKDDENHLYRVKKGNYLGENAGKITYIDTETVELVEMIPNQQGQFSENHANLRLTP
ncbi:MAG: type pilus assembly protein PilP [Pseudomonadota bacterium]|nr:type pilus assembly protein PilP [Pseudomonadota bacterium]